MNRKAILYIHGKGGSAAEAEHYKAVCPGYDVFGLAYTGSTPWDTEAEFQWEYDALAARYDDVTIIANSIGAYFTMHGLQGRPVKKALFISPVVQMEKLIATLMQWANVSEERLREAGEIETDFGETLSWEYLQYVRRHPIAWRVPTAVLYAGNDHLVARETVEDFCREHDAALTVMENGEHWFHTEEQMAFLNAWVRWVL